MELAWTSAPGIVECVNDGYEATHYGEDETMPLCPECSDLYEDITGREAVSMDEI